MSDTSRLDTTSGYDRWSQVYDQDLNPLIMLEEPVVRSWLQSPAGLHIADVGCGTGRHALWLAEAGAVVDAYDGSAGMMSKARQKIAAHGVRLHHHVIPEPLPAEDNTFDIVLLALVADHLADLHSTFADLRRVLKTGGELLFTVMHPAMSLLGVSARFRDPHSGEKIHVESVEHTYADYVMAFLRAGFTLQDIIETKADAALLARTPRAEKYVGWPMLLAMRLRKP